MNSAFLLENGNWQIFGLDSAWQSIDIKGSKGNFHRAQPPFVKQIREANRDKGGVILSHHQPLSSYEGDSPKMIKDLRPALDQGLANKGSGGYLLYNKATKDDATLQWQVGGQPLDVTRTYKVLFNDFLLTGLEKGLPFLAMDKEENKIKKIRDSKEVRAAVVDALKKTL